MPAASQTIAVIDFGMGNLASVANALRQVAPDDNVVVTRDVDEIDAASRVVFPGQGALPSCMAALVSLGLDEAVRRAAKNKPVLGVCVGEQLLLDSSDESVNGQPTTALGLIPGQNKRFADHRVGADGLALKVPHMGWNKVFQQRSHPLWDGIDDGAWFYFVHSYYAVTANRADSAGETDYGHRFTCALARDNIFATQFHPEKSAEDGLRLYRNFVRWNP